MTPGEGEMTPGDAYLVNYDRWQGNQTVMNSQTKSDGCLEYVYINVEDLSIGCNTVS